MSGNEKVKIAAGSASVTGKATLTTTGTVIKGTITTVKGFIGKIFEEKDPKKEQGVLEDDLEVFYRGHSNREKYKLEPSLFRKDADDNYIYRDNEHILYRELLIANPTDFSEDEYTLDRLVRMQHYSLPTRLLDITSNPLIALYFACKSGLGKKNEKGAYEGEEEGEVIQLSTKREQIKYFDSDMVSCIANLARLPKTEKDMIDFENQNFNNQASINRLIHFIREEKPFFENEINPDDLQKIVCVKSKRSNSRITFQSGAFLLFGLNAKLSEGGNHEIQVRRIVVKNKTSILNELDLLNINESTVFPYIENSAKYVAQKYAFNHAIQPAE